MVGASGARVIIIFGGCCVVFVADSSMNRIVFGSLVITGREGLQIVSSLSSHSVEFTVKTWSKLGERVVDYLLSVLDITLLASAR